MFLLLICLTFSVRPTSKHSPKRRRFPLENKQEYSTYFEKPKQGCPPDTVEVIYVQNICTFECFQWYIPYCAK